MAATMKRNLIVTPHAFDRWICRHSGDIETAIESAVPFGAQRGDAFYLRSGDAVFACKGGRVVTVLTLMQAVANMQQQGLRFNAADVLPTTPVIFEQEPEAVCVAPKKKKAAKPRDEGTASVNRFLNNLLLLNDDQLQESFSKSPYQYFVNCWLKMKRQVRDQMRRSDTESLRARAALMFIKERLGEAAFYECAEMINDIKAEVGQ